MKQFEYTITDKEGIHARPAGLLVKQAGRYASKITMTKGEKTGDCKRLFAIMGLGVKCGDTVTITLDGQDEKEAALALTAFLKDNL